MEETAYTELYNLNCNINEKGKKEPTFFQNAALYFDNFCDNTSIHGFKFLGERNRTFSEKIFWFLVLIGAITSSTYLIYGTYREWITSPIMVTFAMTETPIWKIPFPAVTVCPEIVSNASVFNYTDVYLKYSNGLDTTEEEDSYFNLYSLICNEDLDFINHTETQFITLEDTQKFLDNFGYDGVENCKWLGKKIDYEKSFENLLTEEGWCTTFNMLAYNDLFELNDEDRNNTSKPAKVKSWSLEEGYPPNAGLNAYPRRTTISGINGGLQIDFELEDDDLDYLCSDLQGFKVAVHHPAEDPDMKKYFRVPLNQVVLAAIKPRMITTADKIKSYDVVHRQCYMPGEKVLSTYKIYSQQNCLFDCLANFTLAKCGCSLFYITVNDTICGAGSKECVNEAKINFFQEETNIDLNTDLNSNEIGVTEHCNCLPPCTSLEFDAETSQTEWNWRKAESIKYNPNESDFDYLNDKKYKSRLVVYYKDLQFMTSERHELYGPIDFLANCGGLLGLCCGFSLTSLMEIIYYLTLRIYNNVSKFGYKIWSGAEELTQDRKER